LPQLPFLYRAALVLGLSLGLAPGLLAQDAILDDARMVVEVERTLGMTIATLTPDLAQQYKNIRASYQGVVVTAVTPGGPAARAGLVPGELIEEIRVLDPVTRSVKSERITSVHEFVRAARLSSKNNRERLHMISRQSHFTRPLYIDLPQGAFLDTSPDNP
jgi:hypothetical protein